MLAELARRARYPVLLVNDSDIVVEPGYLRAVTAPLDDPARRRGDLPLSRRRRILGLARGGPRHRHRVRAQRAGGAPARRGRIRARLHHGLPRRQPWSASAASRPSPITWPTTTSWGATSRGSGYRVEFAPVVVETDLGGGSWGETWRHQLRWSRTIRVSRPSGYYGYVVTHATLWSLVALAAGQWLAGAAALAVRIAGGSLGRRRHPPATARCCAISG